jgi:predicted PurR-regulated permease PerM
MRYLDNKINNSPIAATTIFLLVIAIIFGASTSIATTAVAATTTTSNNTTTTAATSLSSGIVLSPQPIYQERAPPGSLTPINQTHISATHSGNGTLTLPDSTQTIDTTSNGRAILSFATSSAYAKSTIRAANGETATLTVYCNSSFPDQSDWYARTIKRRDSSRN